MYSTISYINSFIMFYTAQLINSLTKRFILQLASIFPKTTGSSNLQYFCVTSESKRTLNSYHNSDYFINNKNTGITILHDQRMNMLITQIFREHALHISYRRACTEQENSAALHLNWNSR